MKCRHPTLKISVTIANLAVAENWIFESQILWLWDCSIFISGSVWHSVERQLAAGLFFKRPLPFYSSSCVFFALYETYAMKKKDRGSNSFEQPQQQELYWIKTFFFCGLAMVCGLLYEREYKPYYINDCGLFVLLPKKFWSNCCRWVKNRFKQTAW